MGGLRAVGEHQDATPEKEIGRLKPRTYHYLALTAFSAAGLALGGRAHSQGIGAVTYTAPVLHPGQVALLPPSQTFIALSPETTVFQFRLPHRDAATGKTRIDTLNQAGTTLLLEKLYYLPPNRKHGTNSSASIGAWYWFHSSSSDKLTVYGNYFYDSRVGFQVNVGGDTHLGLFEYYGFLLANAKVPSPKSPIGIQLGIGPYFNRRNGQSATFSGGDTGVAALLGVSYNQGLKSRISYSGELRYINYRAPAQELGLSTTDSLVRVYAGVNYRL